MTTDEREKAHALALKLLQPSAKTVSIENARLLARALLNREQYISKLHGKWVAWRK